MATRVNMMKLLQEIRGLAELGKRRPPTRAPGLFLMQLRSHVFRTTHARRPLTIPVNEPLLPDVPHPVKIIHR
jgi:hypothetical protein